MKHFLLTTLLFASCLLPAQAQRSEAYSSHSWIRKTAPEFKIKNLEKGSAIPVTAKVKGAAAKVPSAGSCTFFESFEDWDGTTENWIPTTWSENNSSEEIVAMENGKFTWQVLKTGDNQLLPAAVDGEKFAAIYFAQQKVDGKRVDYNQDEWLISPAITPADGDVLTFSLGFNPFYLLNANNIDWNAMEYTKREPATTLQVLIKQSDAEEWTLLKDVYDDYKDLDFTTLFKDYNENVFREQEIDISGYAGKSVQIAFRFVGIYGNTMELDAVKVAAPSMTVLYRRPQGAFYVGYSQQYDISDGNNGDRVMLAPAYTDITWKNLCSANASSFEWTYSDAANDGKTFVSSDADLTMNHPHGVYDIPQLKAATASGDNGTYKYDDGMLQLGGTVKSSGSDVQYGMCNYNPNLGFTIWGDNSGNPIFGYHSTVDTYWSGVFGVPAHVFGIGDFVEKPLRPYVVSTVWVSALGEVADDAQLSLTIYKLSEQGLITSTAVATGQCTGADIVKTAYGSTELLSIPFAMTPAEGYGSDGYVVINDAVAMVISGFDNEKVTSLGILQTKNNDPIGESNGFFRFSYEYYGNTYSYDYNLNVFSSDEETYNGSFLFNTDAAYPWIESEASAYTFAREGGSHKFVIDSYYGVDKWTVDATGIEEEAVEWLSFSITEDTLTVKATEMDAATTERQAIVTLSTPGAQKVFTISQNQATEIGTVSTVATKAVVRGNQILIAGKGDATYGKLFDATGLEVLRFSLSGTDSVNTQQLPQGVYLLKLNNGYSTKLVNK